MTKNAARTTMSFRNVTATFINRFASLALNFIGRTVFIRTLGTEYLGLGGLFGNVFSVISLCELGFGAAITQSLYKPIALGDERQVAAIINHFIRIYNIIALVTAILSAAAIPVLPYLVKGKTTIGNIGVVYALFCMHSVLSYLFAPKRTLLICDQRLYVVSLIRTAFSVVILVLQILVLTTVQSYIMYLAVRIILLAAEGVVIDAAADRRYVFLKKFGEARVDLAYRTGLNKNVRALMLHKTGGILTHSTDSILISACLGLQCMGRYSNYALVVGSVGTLIDIAIGAVSASVGNLGATADKKRNEEIMRTLCFANFWLLTVCSAVLVTTINPFLELWIGKKMLFGMLEVAIIVGSFYASCIRDPVQIFLQAYGIFNQSKYMPPVRALVNLVFSLLFIKKLGIAGVFLGTIVSVAAVPLWCEPYLLYKHGFKMKAGGFPVEFARYVLCSVLLCAACVFLTRRFPVNVAGTLSRAAVSFCVVNLAILLRYSKSRWFSQAVQLVARRFRRD